jgi:hypothetical protein
MDFVLILNTEDDGLSITKVDPKLVEAVASGGFLTINLYKWENGKNTKTLRQSLTLPTHKLKRMELLDLTDPNCPPEYIEMVVKEDLKNGKS